MSSTDLVRPSRDGDQFHYHWAARHCLQLLPGPGNLFAVTIEGPSTTEGSGDPVEEGSELIDVGLYYGAENLEEAELVRYIQLKHSTRRAREAWTASGLKKTIRGFSDRYAKLLEQFTNDELDRLVQFEFTTNRPIDSKLAAVLEELANNSDTCHPALRQSLISYTGLSEENSLAFFRLFTVDGAEPDLWAQRNLLAQDVSTYLAESDYDAPVQLKELVTRKATSESESNPSIRRHDVLRALKVSEHELAPSPCQIAPPDNVLPREQESAIRETFLAADCPIIIHADGGVGKSTLATCLAASMPSGSESVLYDCFGDGLYRNALHFRHRHRDALVQIANELAARGLCHPLIPSTHADAKQYMRAFCGRLTQAIELLRGRDPEATLCLIIDAADNAEMAAEEQRDACFVRDLIRTPLPRGVRLAFTCRTHRRQLLDAPPEIHEIELLPFSKSETARYLRSAYPTASDSEVDEFAFLSSSNPRVQALALDRKQPIQNMLKELGPTPTTVDRAIGDLLQLAIDKLKDRGGIVEASQIDHICRGLAVLRPLVPISVLARISGTSESAVRSFALDLGRPLLVKGNSLHFLDEPAETWFREQFQPDPAGLKRFLDRLRPLAAQSSYVASTLPQLLLAAGQLDELVALALSNDGLPTSNPLERRDVELQRLIFALKACLHQKRYLAAAKLVLRAAGETAGESRQIRLIQENTDMASVLLSPDRIEEIVSRRTFASTWMGAHHAYDAGILSGRSEFSADAASRLRMAMDWLYTWARRPQVSHDNEQVDDADRAEITMALLRLRGPESAAQFLRGWTSRRLAFVGGKLLAQRLIDIGCHEQLDSLAHAAGNDIWLLLGLTVETQNAGHLLPSAPLTRLMRLLSDRRVKLPESTEWNAHWDILYAVAAAVTLALRILPHALSSWSVLLRKYLPDTPPSAMSERYGFDRVPLLRAYALEAALRGEKLTLLDVAPTKVREELEAGNTYGRSQAADVFHREVSGLLPWAVLHAEVLCGRVPTKLDECIAEAVQATTRADSQNYQNPTTLSQAAAQEWLLILRDASTRDSQLLASLHQWIGGLEFSLWSATLTSMCRCAARTPFLMNSALEFAVAAFETLEASREDAESKADSYQRLARAVLPASKDEATAYFNRAVEISSKIGDENINRWSAFLQLATISGEKDRPNPKLAYRLSRAAELTYEYVARDKHFDWRGTVKALTNLCGPSTLAILSRWRDRRFGLAERLLPVSIYRLIQQDLLPALTPISLSGISAEWNRLDDLLSAVDHSTRPEEKRLIAQIGYRYMRVQSHSEETWAKLSRLQKSLNTHLPDVDRLLAYCRPTKEEVDTAGPLVSHRYEERQRNDPDWSRFFDGVDLADSTALRKAFSDLKTYDPPYQLEAFFEEGAKCIGTGRVSEFIAAVAEWPDFGIFEFRYLLDGLPESTLKLISVRKALHDAVLAACRREPERVIRRGWGSYVPFERLHQQGIAHDDEVVQATLEGFAVHADMLDAGALFQMIDPLRSRLSPAEAEDALNYGLDLLDDGLRVEDGDGPWTEALLPPDNCVSALAGYVWVGLGSPVAAERWEFAHVVRASVELGWSDFLAALADRCGDNSPIPFVDNGLEFYELHARQWLLIAIARGALENPQALTPFLPALRDAVSEEHVLIRTFAAATLKTLHAAGVVGNEDNLILDAINRTQLPLDTSGEWGVSIPDSDVTQEQSTNKDEKYYFGIDIGPYWFSPLGQVFGVSEQAVEIRARSVLREKLGVNTAITLSDARYTRKIFDELEDTRHSHGSLPSTDDLRVYHAYHAMMIVAAQLLKELPVRNDVDSSCDDFQNWIESYQLSRTDGFWLADRRDPILAKNPPRPEGHLDQTWCWRVSSDYLDRQLTTDDGLRVLWGSWSSGQRNDSESVSVRSSLVSRDGAESLLATLQTARSPVGIFLPDAERDESLVARHLRLSGWVLSTDWSTRLDEEDPWASKLRYPGPIPSESIVEKLALTPSTDGRRWTAEPDVLLRSESWSQVVSVGREKEFVSGTRLSGNREFIRHLLERYPQDCLVVSVSVRRIPPRDRRDNEEAAPYPWPYVRYYLLDSDEIA